MKVGSLFAGIGGFDLGLERTGGFETAWFCEQDEFCQRVLAEHWPGVPCYPDITALHGADVEPVDVLCGGFPCQDLSYAGAGAGLDGARSGLWSEYARLIGELRPRYVLVENVAALLARGLGTVLGDLAALGYDAEWDCIPASAIGAPHRRDRIWLVAYPGGVDGGSRRTRGPVAGGAGKPEPVGALQVADARCERGELRRGAGDMAGSSRGGQGEGDQRQRDGDAVDDRGADLADANEPGREQRRRAEPVRAQLPPAERCGEGVADADGVAWAPPVAGDGGCGALLRPGALERALGCRGGVGDQWGIEPDVGRVADGVPARVDRLRSLGNALVPQIAEWLGQRILDYEGSLSHV